MTVIRHGTLYTPDAVIPDGFVRIIGDRLAVVGVHATEDDQGGSTLPPSRGETEIDARGLLLIPGLIDLQCNGIAGHDALHGGVAALGGISDVLPRFGCTAVLPTLVTAAHDDLATALAAVATAAKEARGAAILGTHMEGPWLNPAFHGAHPVEHVRAFDVSECDALLQAAAGTLRLVTLAPEAPAGMAAVTALASRGVVVSMGHSGASFEDAQRAVHLGARMVTHLFNAMGALHHRAPGLAGAALSMPHLTVGLIPDGYHVHPSIVRMALSARGSAGVAVVTDSVPAAALPPGTYEWHNRAVSWDGETVRLRDGGLAGSGLTPIEALRRLVRHTGMSLADVLPAMTSTPARALGEEGMRGSIAPGLRADLVLLTPDLQVHTTLVGGKVVYRA